jgi:hypothetical protein
VPCNGLVPTKSSLACEQLGVHEGRESESGRVGYTTCYTNAFICILNIPHKIQTDPHMKNIEKEEANEVQGLVLLKASLCTRLPN